MSIRARARIRVFARGRVCLCCVFVPVTGPCPYQRPVTASSVFMVVSVTVPVSMPVCLSVTGFVTRVRLFVTAFVCVSVTLSVSVTVTVSMSASRVLVRVPSVPVRLLVRFRDVSRDRVRAGVRASP